jgi:hypothetical protein
MSKTTRVRGFAPWQPNSESAALLKLVNAVLVEYSEFLPLTVRQVFYRLVGAHGYAKSEKDYKRLGEILNRARRAGLVPFNSLRDDGFSRSRDLGWNDPDSLKAAIRSTVDSYRVDRQRGQDERLVVWCEAQGMVPQLERVSLEYSVPVFSSGGFDSVSVKHGVAREFAAGDQNVRVLHIGDHDPSGVHVFSSLAEDIDAFAQRFDVGVAFHRLAVTPDQISEYELPTAPPKPTDNRSFDGETAQAEALPPDVLAAILRDAIEDHFDMDSYATALEQESTEREQLIVWAQR